MSETIKVQRPVATNNPDALWLIYDRAQKHVEQLPDRLVPNYVREAMGKDHKAYFLGAWSSIVGWGIGTKRKSEDW